MLSTSVLLERRSHDGNRCAFSSRINYYQFAGGEESVVRDKIALLKRMGHEVELYARHNRDLGEANAGAQALWSRRTLREAGGILASFQPHVLHLHNTFPVISPAVLLGWPIPPAAPGGGSDAAQLPALVYRAVADVGGAKR